jgi:NAD(P)-dependent dehydrogenase (short-subunit alcohol dehydrogenase family)
MFALNGRNVLVTGGAGYLGTPVCELLKVQGANVIIADRDVERLEAAQASVGNSAGNGRVATLPLDMGDEASILACVEAATRAFGPLSGLIAATAYNSGKAFEALDGATFDLANRINLTGTFLLARAAAATMAPGGAMVLYSSMYGVVSPDPKNYPGEMTPNAIEYGVGKAGLNQMVRYMAGHYGPRNIRVNALYPGPFPHAAVQQAHPDFIANLEAETMLGRIGRQDETAGAAVFLISDAASYITGQVLGVDGGWTAW